MIRLFINGLAASAGGGLTYLRNVIPHLAQRVDSETTVLLSSAVRHEFRGEFKDLPNVSFVEMAGNSSVLHRFVNEQTTLPKQSGAAVPRCLFPEAILRFGTRLCRRYFCRVTRCIPLTIFAVTFARVVTMRSGLTR